MSEPPEAPTVVDTTGLRCPLPVLELARQVADGRLPPGCTVRVVSDDPAAAVDLPAWCRMRGHTFLRSEPRSDGAVGYLLRLGA